MKILYASSEIVPFAKTGGLADVSNALPKALASLGHEISLIMPAYQTVHEKFDLQETGIELEIPVGSKLMQGKLLSAELPGTNVKVYFVDQQDYFLRNALYGEGVDYDDNCERFVFFSRAVLETIQRLNLEIDILHCNDWQTGLIPAIVRLENRPLGLHEQTGIVITVHNLAYQGNFWHWDMLLTGLDWQHFNWREMEFFGQLNLLKTGLVYADAITTVSPTYAEEIQTAEHGCGLENVLKYRRDDLCGILNGVDYTDWNPELDTNLAANYSVSNWASQKPICKADLQQIMGLPLQPQAPLVGIIGRMAEQKGWDLIIELIKAWLPSSDVQWAILGTGDAKYERAISELVQDHPEKISAQLTFSNELAHKIEAGSDLFLMPSRYEPCGLNQLYSLNYGTVPIVRETGGLKDSVFNADPEAVAAGTANGFSFQDYSVAGINEVFDRAVMTYREHRDVWNQIVENGMKQDWSWNNSAQRYVSFYEQTLEKRRSQLMA